MKKLPITLIALALTGGLSNAAVISNFDFDTPYNTSNDADQGNGTSQTLRLDDTGWGTNGGTGAALSGAGWTITSVEFIFETGNTNVVGLQVSDGVQTISSDNTIDQGTLAFGDIYQFTFSGDTETFDSTSTLTFSFTGGTARAALSGGQDYGGSINSLNTGSVNYSAVNDMAMRITAVPEPSSTALLGLGGLALILRRRK